MSTRERLARAAYEESHPARFGFVSWVGLAPHQQAGWYRNVDTILREQAAIRAEQREEDRRSTEQKVLDDLGQSQPDWAKDILDEPQQEDTAA